MSQRLQLSCHLRKSVPAAIIVKGRVARCELLRRAKHDEFLTDKKASAGEHPIERVTQSPFLRGLHVLLGVLEAAQRLLGLLDENGAADPSFIKQSVRIVGLGPVVMELECHPALSHTSRKPYAVQISVIRRSF